MRPWRKKVEVFDGGRSGDAAGITVERVSGDVVFYLKSEGRLLATASGIGGGRALSEYAFSVGASVVRHDYDGRLDEL